MLGSALGLMLAVFSPAASTAEPAAASARLLDVASAKKSARRVKDIPGAEAAALFRTPRFLVRYLRIKPGTVPVSPTLRDTFVLLDREVSYVENGRSVVAPRFAFKIWRAGEWTGGIELKSPSEMLQFQSLGESVEPRGPKKAKHEDPISFDKAIGNAPANSKGLRFKQSHAGKALRATAVEFRQAGTFKASDSGALFVVGGSAKIERGKISFDAPTGSVVWLQGSREPVKVTPLQAPFQVVSVGLDPR